MSQVLPDAQGTAGEPGAPGPDSSEPIKRIEGRTPTQLALARLKKDRVAVASFFFIVFLVLVAAGAPLIVKAISHPPNDTSLYDKTTNAFGNAKGPNLKLHFWFGADNFGRDLFSRVLYGARSSLVVGVVTIGVEVGIVPRVYRGWVDTALSRLMDILLSLPFLLVALVLVSVFRPSLS